MSETPTKPAFHVGQRVYWTDPDRGLGSGYGTIVYASDLATIEDDTVIALKMDSGSEAEVLPHELTDLAPANTRQLGADQAGCLRALVEHGAWHGTGFGCGWNWGTQSRTRTLMAGLVRRGLATVTPDGEYASTPAGVTYAAILVRRMRTGRA